MKKLKIIAVAAPHNVKKGNIDVSYSLDSCQPFSLHNAIRYAAQKADEGVGFLGESNWQFIMPRSESIIFMNYLEDELPVFRSKLLQIRPSLLLIGSMTLAFPGAIELAKEAKKLLGDDVLVVLGGKHCNETYFYNNDDLHHINSPLSLALEKRIPNVFDLVVSGDGEDIVYSICEMVGKILNEKNKIRNYYKYLDMIKESKGEWLVGYIRDGQIHDIKSKGVPINYLQISSPIELFRCNSKFNVFNRDYTTHAFSYMSKGCVYSCSFCSEGCKINGKLKNISTASKILFNQFKQIGETYKKYYLSESYSIFIEDSILLGGIPKLLDEFYRLLKTEHIFIPFGCQFTIDTLLNPEVQKEVLKLKEVGLSYVFVGLETSNKEIANSMSKNVLHRDWLEKNAEVLQFIKSANIKMGCSLLFGLGETSSNRFDLLRQCKKWKEEKLLDVISLNWAVMHPLRGASHSNAAYIDWGTPANSEYLDVFQLLFGESSVLYKMPNVVLPSVDEFYKLHEIVVS